MFFANLLLHVTGGDNGSGPFYLELSGFVGLMAGCGFIITWYKRHNCHHHLCPRFGKHSVAHGKYMVCKVHHPDMGKKHKITMKHIRKAHKATQNVG